MTECNSASFSLPFSVFKNSQTQLMLVEGSIEGGGIGNGRCNGAEAILASERHSASAAQLLS